MATIDIIFVSRGEPDANVNYLHLLARFPYAKRVDVVSDADTFRLAMKKSTTFTFYMVDSNVQINDTFDFSFKPLEWDKGYEHIYQTHDTATDSIEYGGVRILHKSMLKKLEAGDPIDVKHIDQVISTRSTTMDIVFIDGGGLHAETNFAKIYDRFPYAKLVDSKERADAVAVTPMYYVVDGDVTVYDTFNFDFLPASWDYMYTHHFYVVDVDGKEQLGHVKLKPKVASEGSKFVDQVVGHIKDDIDVVFISYDEPNADVNYYQLKRKVPWAKRVNQVEGIKAAHKRAAQVAKTDTFYVVDADAWVLNEFEFDFVPPSWDTKYVHIFQSRNPVTEDFYGYGGIKIFHKDMFKNLDDKMPIDFSTTTGDGVKYLSTIGCATCFDSDEYHAWRGAYREVSKLLHQTDADSLLRLKKWRDFDHYNDRPHNDSVRSGVHEALADHALCDLSRVNDYEWLALRYKDVINDLA